MLKHGAWLLYVRQQAPEPCGKGKRGKGAKAQSVSALSGALRRLFLSRGKGTYRLTPFHANFGQISASGGLPAPGVRKRHPLPGNFPTSPATFVTGSTSALRHHVPHERRSQQRNNRNLHGREVLVVLDAVSLWFSGSLELSHLVALP